MVVREFLRLDAQVSSIIDGVNVFMQRWLHVSRHLLICLCCILVVGGYMRLTTPIQHLGDALLFVLFCLSFLYVARVAWVRHVQFERTGRSRVDRLSEERKILRVWLLAMVSWLLIICPWVNWGYPVAMFSLIVVVYLVDAHDLDRGDREHLFDSDVAHESG